jgi:hypothetical protein
MTHLIDLLINVVVLLIGIMIFAWGANSASSPLQGKI